MGNHVVIGLGGTGGSIINKLKHKLHSYDDIAVDYLYADSNFDLVGKQFEHLWRVFGDDISLNENNKLRLKSNHLRGAFDFDNQMITPRYSAWAGNIDNWKNIRVQLQGNDGGIFGNQRRRLGRMLLSGNLTDFSKKINFLVNNLQKNTQSNENYFHICCGLAGGTGSGSFIDVLSKLKQTYQGNNNHCILYLFLPEDNPDQKKLGGGNYFSNAYAALKELNSLYTGNWQPYDILQQDTKTDLNSFISTTYLITNTNDGNISLDVDSQQPEEMIADFISLRLTNPEYADQLEQAENSPRQQESENGHNVRSRDFFSFGIKRIIYPKEEINEYMISKILYKLSLALRFNKWDVQSGYVENTKIVNINNIVNSLLPEFKISPEYLLLSKGILDNENQWRSFEDDWANYINKSEDIYRNTEKLNKKSTASNLIIDAEKRYNSIYREYGVKSFFSISINENKRRVEHISEIIQSYLIKKWLSGDLSLPQIKSLIDELIIKTNRTKEAFLEKNTETTRKVNEYREKLDSWKHKLDQSGILNIFTSKNYANTIFILKEYYIQKTYEEAYQYSTSHFLPNLINKLQELRRNSTKLIADFKLYSEKLKIKYQSRLIDDSNNSIEKIYDKEVIDRILNSFVINNRENMDSFKNGLEEIVKKHISDKQDFTHLASIINNSDFSYEVERTLNADLKNIIRAISNGDSSNDITNNNIIGELEGKYKNNPTLLDNYMNKLITESKVYLPLDDVEIQRIPKNNRIISKVDHNRHVLMPTVNNDYSDDIEKSLNRPSTTFHPRNDSLVNEITLFEIQPAFPLRYIQKMLLLSDKYEQRYKNNSFDDIDVQVHLEKGRDFFKNFMIPSIGDLQKDFIHKIFVLDALKLIKQNNQLDGLYLDVYKGNKIINRVSLGDKFINAHRNLSDYNECMFIDSLVNDEFLKIKRLLLVDKNKAKEELVARIDERYKKIEHYFEERDMSRIPFWGQHADRAIKLVDGV